MQNFMTSKHVGGTRHAIDSYIQLNDTQLTCIETAYDNDTFGVWINPGQQTITSLQGGCITVQGFRVPEAFVAAIRDLKDQHKMCGSYFLIRSEDKTVLSALAELGLSDLCKIRTGKEKREWKS